jgi:hypothetical protein
MNDENKKPKDLEKQLEQFLRDGEVFCEDGECYIRTKDGIVEKINKKYITEDGRQLLND